MKKQNNLAIVIPAYKSTFLAAALDSIAAQTCQDFTLYIGDDCSPNNLGEIVDRYRDKINLVYRRFDTNLGGKDLVAQWERCIDMSQGEEWIWLFSDDDVMEKNCVKEFYKLPEEVRRNYVVHFDINVINEFGVRYENLSLRHYPKYMSGLDFMNDKLSGKIVSYVVEYIFPRKLFIETGKFANFDLAWGADILTWFRMANHSSGIYSINENHAHVNWRKSNENITPNKSYQILKRKMEAIIDNAWFVQNELVKMKLKRQFSFHACKVWREIVRNSMYLQWGDLYMLYKSFLAKVGFPIQSFAYISLCYLNKITKIWK